MALVFIEKDTIDCWTLSLFFLTNEEYILLTERQPSDREITKIFEENRDVFEQLRLKALEDATNGDVLQIDSHDSSDMNYTGQSDLSISHQCEYLRLLSAIKPSPVLLIIPDHYVEFELANGGLGPLGVDWSKGIRYIPDNPEKEGLILKDLDKAKKGDGDELLRQLDGHWFLYYKSY
jgi:hypothetical protein